MTKGNNGDKEYNKIDSLLGSLFKPPTLKELFENRLSELNMPPTTAQKILGIGYTPLKRLLAGSKTTVDFVKLYKLADFLQITKEEVITIYSESLEKHHFQLNESISIEKVKFIKKNFDLAVLRKAGFIKSISDFSHIESRIVSRLGLRSIFEYKEPPMDVAFSSNTYNPKNPRTRSFWVNSARSCFELIDNPHNYSREKLAEFFPKIGWYSTDRESGLIDVVRLLYKIGITVIFQPPMENLKVYGATFLVNNKPCVVLSNYYGHYPTLWFTLIHELYHVLFDLEDIRKCGYHISEDSNEQMSVKERENLADDFAREYLLSNDKLNQIRPNIQDYAIVQKFALDNHVDPSIIYAFHAFDKGKSDRMAWARVRRYSPKKDQLHQYIAPINLEWEIENEFEVEIKARKQQIY